NLNPINSLGGVWVTDLIPLQIGTSIMTGKVQISAYASFEGSSLLGGAYCIAFVTDQNSSIVGFIDQSFAEARPSVLNTNDGLATIALSSYVKIVTSQRFLRVLCADLEGTGITKVVNRAISVISIPNIQNLAGAPLTF